MARSARIPALGMMLLLLALAIPQLGPAAEHMCRNRVIVYSVPARVQPAQFTCAAVGTSDAADTRLIMPGSMAITIRYTEDMGEDAKTLVAYLNGLGWHNHPVTLTRAANGDDAVSEDFDYYSPDVLIPSRHESGCVDVSVALPDGSRDNASYRTVGHDDPCAY